jgi:hypothetical protein
MARLHDLPGLSQLLSMSRSRLIPRPTENYRLLNIATQHLFTSPRPLSREDMTPQAKGQLRQLVRQHLEAQGKTRFIMKHTGFPRVSYLDDVFPDARFIHVVRDGRAVAASLCAVDWWSGEGHWGWGPLDPEEKSLYAGSGCHELVLAGLYWKKLMGWLDDVPSQLSTDRLLVLRYDELVADPVGQLKRLAEFADLPWTPKFAARVQATPMTSDDTRWRRTLNPEEQLLIEQTLRPTLVAHGFMEDPA